MGSTRNCTKKKLEYNKFMWKYVEEDNFFSNDDYNLLLNEVKKINILKIGSNEIKITSNKIFNSGEIQNECLTQDLLKKFHSNYHSKLINYLKQLYPEKVELYDFSDFHIVATGKDCNFPIHDDIPSKLLSVVIYLHPEKNSGTTIYSSKKGADKTEIDWKKNRALIFARKKNETWHSYKGNGIENRVTLVYNLCTHDEFSAQKIENPNYTKINFFKDKLIDYLKSKIN